MSTATIEKRGAGVGDWLARLHSIKLGGGGSNPATRKTPRRDLLFIVSNLATLVGNGLSLPKALATLATEQSLRQHADMLESIRRKVEAGESFSAALAAYPGTFNELMVYQVRVGERSGTVAEALVRISEQLEKHNKIRSVVIKRLSYPLVVVVAGVLVVGFMLGYIVPVFQETYEKAHIPLPFITRLLMAVAAVLASYGWMIPLLVVGLVFAWRRARASAVWGPKVDRMLLRLPIVGSWFRDVAVLQFIDVLGTMLDSGFKVVDALGPAAGSVRNAAVRKAVEQLKAAVTRGERLSRELERHAALFPPVISQLVIVGEQTGKLAQTARQVSEHLERQIERKTDVMVGTIEPVLTVGLATSIGFVLLAIYLPMFDMINVIGTK